MPGLNPAVGPAIWGRAATQYTGRAITRQDSADRATAEPDPPPRPAH